MPLKFLSKFLSLFVIISFTHFCSFIAVSRMTALFYIQTPGGAHCAGSTERYFGAQRKNKHLCCEANTGSTCVFLLLCTEAEGEDRAVASDCRFREATEQNVSFATFCSLSSSTENKG